jgi:hypothetical protein
MVRGAVPSAAMPQERTEARTAPDGGTKDWLAAQLRGPS